MSQISLGNIKIELTQKNIKNVHLSVMPPNGTVRISAPLHISPDTIRLYAISKLGWIKKQQNKMRSQVRQSKREFINKESHYFLGKRYLMNIVETNGCGKIVVRNKTTLELYAKKDSSREQKQTILNEWYRKELKSIVMPLIAKWEEVLSVKVEAFGIKQMKTKWGSCNTHARSIWLNLELAKKHPAAIEYVVLHEIVHLVERLHSNRFFALMDRYMPQWREYKKELGLTL
ncbi:MAG TPA: SprT family zinc-dependent metalloprotease [Campylobacterales bacterium]|nr:SprT family zinc-dependent metalloprotease [Campylobacterales bacterium]